MPTPDPRGRPSGIRRLRRCLAGFATLALVAPAMPAVAQAPTATVSGRVTDVVTSQPIAGVRVVVQGTTVGTQTADDGRYTIRGAPTGAQVIEFTRIGYEPKRVPATLTAGQAAVVNMTMGQAAYSLSAVVTTVTGQQRKVELANTTAQINVAEKLAETPVNDLSGLLSGRAAGVQVTAGGATGSGSRIRIRGQGSLSLNNEPLVYIDGVRVTSSSGSSSIGVGGSTPSRLNDINPAEIENIEIVKGPSAATLYGTEAANGVINITTKRGKAGKTQWNVFTENGTVTEPNTYPDLYFAWGTNVATGARGACLLTSLAAGQCRQDSLIVNNTINNPATDPRTTGNRQLYGLQASGGNDRVQFFVSGQFEDELGVYKMPASEVTRLEAERRAAIPIEQLRPNALNRINLRTNLTATLTPTLNMQVSSGYVTSSQRLPQNEDNANGLMVNAIGGLARTDTRDNRGIALNGWRAFPMGDVFSRTTSQDIDRFTNSLATRWNPTSWLATRATVGIDFAARVDNGINLFDQGINNLPGRLGQVTNNRTEITQYTVDIGATASRTFFGLGSKTSAGVQYFRNIFDQTGGSGEQLPPGATTVTAAAIRNGQQTTDETITLGYYAEQQFAWRDQLFLTGGLRLDDNSAFGAEFDAVLFPKVGLSWLASGAGFFPKWNWLETFRLRATYGASGQQPGTTDALRFFSPFPTTLTGGVDAPGVTLGALGNPNLKPEYSGELETGFDLTLLQGRFNLELTYYDKKTRDALISRVVAPSLAGVAARFENIGSVRNSGFEWVLNSQLFDRKLAAMDLTVTGSTNRNRVITLGEGIAPIPTGNRNTQLNLPGYPLFGMWGRPVSFRDANADGLLVPSEVTFGDNQFIGPSFPTLEMAVSPSIQLFNKKVRINAQFDRRSGMRKLNNTLRHQCQGGQACRGLFDRAATLEEQAKAIAATAGIFTPFYEVGDFTRWREASISYQMPDRLARAIKAARWQVILTGRNLAVWTPYGGVDPEATVSNTDARGNEEFFSTPPLRYLTFRMNLTY
jgi:TonB-linked SusC/RagA family outer membrane protein